MSGEFKEGVVQPILRRALKRDEFLGRINELVYFLPFGPTQLAQLALRELGLWKGYPPPLFFPSLFLPSDAESRAGLEPAPDRSALGRRGSGAPRPGLQRALRGPQHQTRGLALSHLWPLKMPFGFGRWR